MGRKTYEFGYEFGLEPGQPAYSEFNLKNYVFSNSLNFASSDMFEIVRGGGIEFVKRLKNEPGKDIYLCGGGILAEFMLQNKLIDQLILKLNPVVFGQGIGLFGDSQKRVQLRLFDRKTFDNGVQFLSYYIDY